MSTALESNSRVDDMTDFEILMHEDVPCGVLNTDCYKSAEWQGRFCRPCGTNAVYCSEHKNTIESWIKRNAAIVCVHCANRVDHKDITWTKI